MAPTARGIVAVLTWSIAALVASPRGAFAKDPDTGKVPKSWPKDMVHGFAKNGMGWHVRVPKEGGAGKTRPAIVILHGSNMNSMDYVATIANTWPGLRDDFVLIGLDGEKRVAGSPDDAPRFNYTYVDFVGKSKLKGYPGTDRESPALVAEVLQDLKERFHVSRYFVGGHSQGGFLTYSVMMNYPELVAGAFPISAGLIIQCEPTAFEREEVRKAQRKVPLAIVHAQNDPVVEWSMGQWAANAFEDDGFTLTHFFQPNEGAHMFAMLPVEEAVRWLEAMASSDPAALAAFAKKRLEAGETHDAAAAIAKARELDKDGKNRGAIDAVSAKIEAKAKEKADELLPLLKANKDGSWVDSFLRFRGEFGPTSAAEPVLEAYDALRAKHQKPADELHDKGFAAMQKHDEVTGWKCYGEIVEKYYASSWYRPVKQWIADRK
jgi:predicted esterase